MFQWYIQKGKMFIERTPRGYEWTPDFSRVHLFDDIRVAERVATVGCLIRKFKPEEHK